MILQILFACLLIELMASLYIFKGDFLSPAVIFNGVFTVAALDLLIMVDYWDVSLKPITMTVILSGTVSFTLVSVITRYLPSVRLSFERNAAKREREIYIPNHILNITIILYTVLIFGVMFYSVRQFGFTLSFANYVTSISEDTEVVLPAWLSILNIILSNGGYAWGYLLTFNWAKNRKINKKLVILFAETLLVSVAGGKRGTAVSLAICLIICLLIALKKNTERKIPKKVYFIIAIIMLAVIFSFQWIATTMGRDSYLFNPFEYFSIHLGAPILNLDTSIRKGGFSHPVFLSETFHTLYKSLGENFNISAFMYETDRVFLSANGLRTGNVDTVFYDFYHDSGLAGVIILSALMAFIAQSMYNRIKRNRAQNSMFSVMLYSYVLWLVARSFFANSLFEWVTLSTIYTLVIWWLESKIFTKSI